MSAVLVVAALRWDTGRTRVHPLTGAVESDVLAGGAAAADRSALEHGLRLAELHGGRCVAVTVGPPAAEAMLREALACGAADVLRVTGPDENAEDAGDAEDAEVAEDAETTARTLLDAVLRRFGSPDLIVCGDRSAGWGTSATPAVLAGLLGAAQATGLVALGSDGSVLRAVRRLDGGRRELLDVPLPAVCSVEAHSAKLRRAALPAVLAAQSAPVPAVRAEGAGARGRVRTGAVRPYRPRPVECPAPDAADPRERLLALTGALEQRTPPRLVTPPTPAEAVDELLGYLREHGYLDSADTEAGA
ncbi:mycofactocin-associated electron transfer flavoprotein beta subunit [Streptomyces sp. NPDC002181]|uniref:mycofactocin-associated electron transfer flavoprotein beta subunit n=1 Tax=Streptomyces sp. NPDC002181 TaxID=3364635 RepID=UPI00368E1532